MITLKEKCVTMNMPQKGEQRKPHKKLENLKKYIPN